MRADAAQAQSHEPALPSRPLLEQRLGRAASRGPDAYAKRVVRRKTYGKSMGATGKLLRIFGLK